MMSSRRLALLAAVLILGALGATSASAHAFLERTSPGDGETVDEPPTEVRLEFSEPVSAPVGAVRVFDEDGERVDIGSTNRANDDATIVAPLDGAGDGTHIVTWRAVSADGHPIKGAFLFHVGSAGGEIGDDVISGLLGTSDRPFGAAAGVARWLTYLVSLLVVGAFVFSAVVSNSERTAIARILRWGSAVGIVVSLIQIPLFAAETTGLGFSALTSGAAWGDAIAGTVGIAALLRAGGYALMLMAAAGVTFAGWGGAAVLVGAEMVTGHTRTTDPAWVTWAADAFHVSGAAIWFGGLAAFALTLHRRRRDDDPVGAATTVGRFSTLAAWSVLGLTVAGGVLAWTQVRALHALTSTTYGWTLIAKAGLVALVLVMAVYNNRVLVPSITGSREDAPKAWARLGRTVRWEIGGIVLALGLTAMLVNIQPAAEAAGVSGVYSTFVPFGEGQLNLVVDPNRVGTNEVHIYLLTPGGLPTISQGGVTIEMSLPSEEIGPFVREAEFAGPGHFLHTGPELALPGRWEITVVQRVSEFAEESVVIPVVVNG